MEREMSQTRRKTSEEEEEEVLSFMGANNMLHNQRPESSSEKARGPEEICNDSLLPPNGIQHGNSKEFDVTFNEEEALKHCLILSNIHHGPEVDKKEIGSGSEAADQDCCREKMKRHRSEIGGWVWVPEIWGQERFLKDWIDCSAFDSSLVPTGVVSAREALIREFRRANSGGLGIENRC